jgi:hypothetical protein
MLRILRKLNATQKSLKYVMVLTANQSFSSLRQLQPTEKQFKYHDFVRFASSIKDSEEKDTDNIDSDIDETELFELENLSVKNLLKNLYADSKDVFICELKKDCKSLDSVSLFSYHFRKYKLKYNSLCPTGP